MEENQKSAFISKIKEYLEGITYFGTPLKWTVRLNAQKLVRVQLQWTYQEYNHKEAGEELEELHFGVHIVERVLNTGDLVTLCKASVHAMAGSMIQSAICFQAREGLRMNDGKKINSAYIIPANRGNTVTERPNLFENLPDILTRPLPRPDGGWTQRVTDAYPEGNRISFPQGWPRTPDVFMHAENNPPALTRRQHDINDIRLERTINNGDLLGMNVRLHRSVDSINMQELTAAVDRALDQYLNSAAPITSTDAAGQDEMDRQLRNIIQSTLAAQMTLTEIP